MAKVPFPCCCGDVCDSLGTWYLTISDVIASSINSFASRESAIGVAAGFKYWWTDVTLHSQINRTDTSITFVSGDFLDATTLEKTVAIGDATAELYYNGGGGVTDPDEEVNYLPYTVFFNDITMTVRIKLAGTSGENRKVSVAFECDITTDTIGTPPFDEEFGFSQQSVAGFPYGASNGHHFIPFMGPADLAVGPCTSPLLAKDMFVVPTLSDINWQLRGPDSADPGFNWPIDVDTGHEVKLSRTPA